MNIITQAFLEAIKKGLVSLAWRLGAIAATGILALLGNTIGLLNLSPAMVLLIGGVLGEITKQVNTWASTKMAVAARNK